MAKLNFGSILTAVAVGIFRAAAAHAESITLPEETYTGIDPAVEILSLLKGRDYDKAAAVFQTRVDESGLKLFQSSDGLLQCVTDRMVAVIGRSDAAALSGRLDRLSHLPQLDDAFTAYEFSFRHPLTKAGGEAKQAARRLWAVDGETPTVPAKPVPVVASWYPLTTGYAADKSMAVTAAAVVFTTNGQSMFATDAEGNPRWRADFPDAAELYEFRPGATRRGVVLQTAVSTDVDGKATIVIATRRDHHNEGRLWAVRATDGRILWTGDGPAVLSPPTVVGRSAYVVTLETDVENLSADLWLSAVDITDGKLLHKTHLAAIGQMPGGPGAWQSTAVEMFRDQGPPTVAGDTVVVSPNIGAVFAVDRFDGHVRWVRTYRPAPIEDRLARIYNQFSIRQELKPPISWTQMLRWTNQPVVAGDVVVVAPQDTDAAMGIDLGTGAQLWESATLPQGSPVGAAGGKVIWGTSVVDAVNSTTGLGSWEYKPPAGVRLTGPPVVDGDGVTVATSGGVVRLTADK